MFQERITAIDHYTRMQTFYQRLTEDASIHLPLWLEGTRSLAEANRNAQITMARTCRPLPGQRILDAGCGLGGTAVWLAREFGVQVTGISNSASNVAACRALAKTAGTTDLTTFWEADLMTEFAEANSFHHLWSLESLNYLCPKRTFIDNAFRLLKPGGWWLCMDRYLDLDLSVPGADRTRSELKVLTEGFYTRAHWETPAALQSQMMQAGFTEVAFRDFTSAILAVPKYRRVNLASALKAAASTLLNPRSVGPMVRATRVIRASYKLMESGAMKYGLLSGKKGDG